MAPAAGVASMIAGAGMTLIWELTGGFDLFEFKSVWVAAPRAIIVLFLVNALKRETALEKG